MVFVDISVEAEEFRPWEESLFQIPLGQGNEDTFVVGREDLLSFLVPQIEVHQEIQGGVFADIVFFRL